MISATLFAFQFTENGNTALPHLLRYPVLLVSTISTIAKVRFGFLLTSLTVLTYAHLLTSEAGKHFIFTFTTMCCAGLLLPYLMFLTLVPLTTTCLTNHFSSNVSLSKSCVQATLSGNCVNPNIRYSIGKRNGYYQCCA
jgi:hypothetical protein